MSSTPVESVWLVRLWCLATGLALAASVPPWGWWPLAVLGVASLDRLLAHQPARMRARRAFLVAVGWFAPSMFWMIDLTPPGYLVAVVGYAGMYAAAGAACPPGRGRRIALPGALVLASALRSAWPFGGVPLSTLAMSLAGSPLLPIARVAGPLGLVAVAAVLGVVLSAIVGRQLRTVAVGVGLVAIAVAAAGIAPSGGPDEGTIRVALVQGGGEQRTRFTVEGAGDVFDRHLAATELVSDDAELIVWPENVVNTNGPAETHADGLWFAELRSLAASRGVTLVPGIFEDLDDENTNYSLTIGPDGEIVDRYDKAWIVPFGEFVPLRGVVEPLADMTGVGGDLPQDARRGSGPAVLQSEVGPMGVLISWEVFFAHRARDAVRDGGEILLNPTNGSSYWLTQVQTQQVAASRLRAVETGRWLLQAAPTGFTALVAPDGAVQERSEISERRVIEGTVARRTGTTWAVRWGDWPALAASIGAIGLGWIWSRSDRGTSRARGRDQIAVRPRE